MNCLKSKDIPITEGKHPFWPPVEASALMLDNEHVVESPEQVTSVFPHDARQLVRLVQCRRCSKPYTSPVTLPCGHAVCRTCLPEPQPRLGASYPNIPARQLGIACPLPECKEEHPSEECSVDVTLTKLLDLIRSEISAHNSSTQSFPIILEELRQHNENTPVEEKEKVGEFGQLVELHGGRLESTFIMAEQGKLHYDSEITYSSPTQDEGPYRNFDMTLLGRLREVTHRELDCLVCYNIMLDPTTTACGHTFCRRCLIRVLDHSNACPICRRGINIPPSLQSQPSNGNLVALLDSLCKDLLVARQEALKLEEQHADDTLSNVPLFIVTLALPTMPTFLHVFEPRYRLMIRRAMEGNRKFGMIMYNRASMPQGTLGATQFLEYGTLLEIINLQQLPDGRSFVECVGIDRFRVRGHRMLDGYTIGNVERVEDVSIREEERLERDARRAAQEEANRINAQSPPIPLTAENFPDLLSTQELYDRCNDFVQRMSARSAPWLSARIVQVYGSQPEDPALFPYWFAAVLPIAEEEKYLLLSTTSVRERLKIVYGWIKRIEGQRWPSGSACSIL